MRGHGLDLQMNIQKDCGMINGQKKQLSSVSRRQGKYGCASAGNIGGDGNPKNKSARSRHNRRQRELYQKRKNFFNV